MSESDLSRRRLLGASGALGLLAATTAMTPAQAAGREVVLWGSSSAISFRADYPKTTRRIAIHEEMARLGMPTIVVGHGGWHSQPVLAIRSKRHAIRPDYDFVGARDEFPQSGSFVIPTLNDFDMPSIPTPKYGYIEGQRVRMESVLHRPGKVRFTRLHNGRSIPIRTSQSGHWVTELDDKHRGKIHLLWMGKNNFEDVDRVIADTKAAFDREPSRTLVLSHWPNDSNYDTPGQVATLKRLNERYRRAFGSKYVDTSAILTDRRWWSLPEIARLNLGARADTAVRARAGVPPRPICSNDRLHLNSYGNLIMAHGLVAKLKSMGWY